jgi:hypothetical protein
MTIAPGTQQQQLDVDDCSLVRSFDRSHRSIVRSLASFARIIILPYVSVLLVNRSLLALDTRIKGMHYAVKLVKILRMFENENYD